MGIFLPTTILNIVINWVTVSLFHLLQDQLDAAVKQLLALKEEYKRITGQEYKPGVAPPQKAPAPVQNGSTNDLYEKVAEQGELVRKLKAEKAPKVRFYHLPKFLRLCSFQ